MFKDDGFSYRAKIDIVPASSQGDFTVGISSTGNSADATWPYDLIFDTTYRATVEYDQSQNIAQLWIDASSENDESIMGSDEDDPGTSITQFGLRQSDSSNNESIHVDNLSITQTFGETLSSNQFQEINFDIELFPNPTSSGFVNVSANQNGLIYAEVYDILGKLIISSAVNNNILTLNDLKSGIYIVKITQNNKSEIKKLIIK